MDTKIDTIIKEHLVFLSITLLLVVAIAMSGFIISRQRDRIVDLQNQYARQRKPQTTMIKTDQTIEHLLVTEAALKQIIHQIPSVNQMTDDVGALNDILSRYHLASGDLVFKPEYINAISIWKYSSAIRLQGDYQQLRNVLAHIQNLKGLFCIKRLSLKRNPHDIAEVDLNLTVATYCRPYNMQVVR